MPKNISKRSELAADWAEFVLQHNEFAYKRIYLSYYHQLFKLGSKKGFDADTIQDTINDLFLYVWENAERLTHVKNHQSYLTASFLRKLYKHNSIETESVADLTELPESFIVPSAETLYIYNNLNKKFTDSISQMVDNLPERQRLMIYQKFYLGLSYDEIANTNQVSVNTVYNTIYKAIASLKKHLNDDNFWIISLLMALFYFFSFFFK